MPKKKYATEEERKAARKEYRREYYQRPEVKERERIRRQTPKMKEYHREYKRRPAVKEQQRKYNQTPKRKEYHREYYQRPAVKERQRKYSQTPKMKEYYREYRRSPKARWCSIQRRAKKKGLLLNLCMEQVKKMISCNCLYCDQKPDEGHSNGLDRINNKDGYVIHNVVPCCARCNWMKVDWPLQDFLNACSNVVAHQNGSHEEKNFDFEVEFHPSPYSAYKYDAKKKGRSFELTEEEYDIITNQSCTYCGSPPKVNIDYVN